MWLTRAYGGEKEPISWHFSSDFVIAIVGATGVGKSALADLLALTLKGEVINADSMQVYRGMDIGTAKLEREKRSVPYHCIDLVTPDHPYTAALYQHDARAAIAAIRTRERLPIFCGGSGLYLRAALDNFIFDEKRGAASDLDGESARGEDVGSKALSEAPSSPTEPSSKALRVALTEQVEEMGAVAFHALLAARDAASAELIHPNNVRRVIRAFELLASGTTYAEQQAGFSSYQSLYPVCYLGIEVAREVLYEVIDRRVDTLMAQGLLEELKLLVAAGYREAPGLRQAIGYKELLGVLDGDKTLEAAVMEIKQATRRYAKRQGTWFRRDKRITWIDATDLHKKRLAETLSSKDFMQCLLMRTLDSGACNTIMDEEEEEQSIR